MAEKTIKDLGVVQAENYFDSVVIKGKTNTGKVVQIKLKNAIVTSDIELQFQEKSEVVPEIIFEACYDEIFDAFTSTEAPYEIVADEEVLSQNQIVYGYAKVFINEQHVGDTRGGATFTRGAVFRDIVADGDRGKRKGRVVIDEVRPQIKVNLLEITKNFVNLVPGLKVSD